MRPGPARRRGSAFDGDRPGVPVSGREYRCDTLIVGAGFGGLCMGARLRAAGNDDFVIVEKGADVGGTWRDNTYPGAECDVPSVLYSLSYAHNPTWSFKWAKQPQILRYIASRYRQFGLDERLHTGRAVRRAEYRDGRWQVHCDGARYSARVVISAVGQLHHPRIPDFDGRDVFAGPQFHSARWRHDVPLEGQRVAVVGSAASAIQLVPEIAPRAGQLTVYQRSANWILPKGDRPYTRLEHAIARRLPALARLYRLGIWCYAEYGLYPIIRGRVLHKAIGRWRCRRALHSAIADPALRAALWPDYPIGAKRILFSDRYYDTLARDDVALVTEPISRLTQTGIETRDGRRRVHDVIVYATGFHTNPFLKAIDVRGLDGARLAEHWHGGAHAYLGVATHGFPNFFFMYGPNTNTGHMSVVYMLETQAAYIARLLALCGDRPVTVREDVERRFDDALQARLSAMVWNDVSDNWYRDGDRITNNWPGSARAYRRLLACPRLEDYRFV